MPDPQPATNDAKEPSPRNQRTSNPTTERAVIWERSHLRGILWDIGDMFYYLGLIATVIHPLTILANEIPKLPSRGILLTIAIPLLCLITPYPTSLLICLALKKLARGHTTRNAS
jgi:hypothetical protein